MSEEKSVKKKYGFDYIYSCLTLGECFNVNNFTFYNKCFTLMVRDFIIEICNYSFNYRYICLSAYVNLVKNWCTTGKTAFAIV